MEGYNSVGETDDGYEGASYDDRSANDYESDAFSLHDGGYTEEEHIAATIIQCMVRRDQAIMFVDVLWEQTAAALSLQSVVRAFLTRCKFSKLIAIHKEMGGAARKYALAAAARAEGGVGSLEASEGEPTSQPTSRPGSALRRTGNSLYSDGEGDDSDWEERYYASSPEHSMFESQKGVAEKTKGRVSKTMASLANASPNAQQMFAAAGQIPTPGLHDNQGNDDDEPPSPHAALKAKLEVPAGSVAAQRQALEAARLAKEQADAAKAAADQASQLSRAEARARKEEAKRAAAAAAEAEELAKQASEKAEAEARAAAGANSASTGDPAAAASARHQHTNTAAANNQGANDGADSSVSSSLSQSSRRAAPPLWPAAKMAPKPAAAPLWPQSSHNDDRDDAPAAEKERGPSPDRAALAGSGVAKRAAAAVHAMMHAAKENVPENDREPRKRSISPRGSRSRPSSREPSPRPPSRQNDADSQIASGALIRAAESFGQSVAGNNGEGRKSAENDAAKAVAPGAAKSRLHKFEQAAQAVRAARAFAAAAGEVRTRRRFKHSLSGHNVVTGLSMGSQGMPGMDNKTHNAFHAAAQAARFVSKAGQSEVSLFCDSSRSAPGMAKEVSRSDNLVGAGTGKALHQGATFVTAGSLNAPGMAKGNGARPASMETLGASAGSAYAPAKDLTGYCGTLLTNGSSKAPGMSHHKLACRVNPGDNNNGGGSGSGVGEYGSAVAHLPKSVDTGLSLFAMGSALSQAKAAEARLKAEWEAEHADMAADMAAASGLDPNEDREDGEASTTAKWNGGGMTSHVPGTNTFGSTMRMQPSADLPLWSLGSSVSVAALAETGGRAQHSANAASSNTFGAAMSSSGGGGGAQNSAIPLWSLGSATAPGMQRPDVYTAAGVRSNCSAASQSAAQATLLSFGSSGAPGMTRDKVWGNIVVGNTTASCSHEPTMLSMGSSTADGMKRNTNSTFGITSGATAAGAPTNYNGSKWSAGGSSGYSYYDSTRSFTGIPTEEQPATKPVKREVEGVRSITSAACGASAVDPTGFYGTRLTTGSVHQMGKQAQTSAEGLGRSIMQGADASGKPVYQGMTFVTAGSHKRDDCITGSTMSSTMGAASRGRSGQPTTRRPRDPHGASSGPQGDRSMSPASARHRSQSPSQRVTFGGGGEGYDDTVGGGDDNSRYDYRGRRDYHMDTADLLAGRPISSGHGRSRSPNAHLAKGGALPGQRHGRRTSPDAQRRGGGGSHADESYGGGDFGLTSNSSLRTAGDHTSAGQAAIDRALARAQQAAQVLAASRTSTSDADAMPRAERRLLREREAAASRGEFYLNDRALPSNDHHRTSSGYEDDVEATGAEIRLRLIQNTSARGSAPPPPKHISSASSVDSSTVMSTATYPDPPQQQPPRKSKWAADERGQWIPNTSSGNENNTEVSNAGKGSYSNDYADNDDNLSTTSSTIRKPPPPAAWTGGAPASTGALAEEVAKRAMGIQQRRNSGHGAGPTGYSALPPPAAPAAMTTSTSRSQSSRYHDAAPPPPSAPRPSLASRAQEGTPASPPPIRARRAVVEKLLSAEAAAASGAVAENRMRRQQAKLNRLQARADQAASQQFADDDYSRVSSRSERSYLESSAA